MAKVAIVTGSATGLGAACAVDLAGSRLERRDQLYASSKKEADETYEAVKAKGVEAILVQADMGQDADCRKLAAETLKKWGRIDGLRQQRRHDQVPEPGRSRRRQRRGLRPYPAGQRHRPLHDEPRRLSDDEEAVGRQAGARLDRQHLVDRRRDGRGHVDPLCRLEGRAQHADPVVGTLVRPRGAGQHGVPGLHPDPLAAGRARPGELREAARRRRSRQRRCARPAHPSRWPRQ